MKKVGFLKKNRFLITYGLLLAFLSSFGQTFLISLYLPSIQKTFSLTDAGFSSIYAAATILSALLITWIGRFIDKVNIVKFTFFVIVGLCVTTLLFSLSYYLPVLFLAIFGLRLFGQGLLTHTSVTAMARFFDKGRGKAISIASLGHPLGEILLPILMVTSIYSFGWRITGLLSVAFIVCCIPLVLYLLRHNTNFTQLRGYAPSKFSKDEENQTKPIQIMKSKAFWYLTPSMVVASSFGTGFLLFKLKMGLSFDWTPTFVAVGFTAYSVGGALANLLGGFLADRYSGKKMFVFYLLPAMTGFLCLTLSSNPWVYIALIGGIGISNGFGGTVKNVVLAEMYGTKIIGSVRSLFITIMVFSTALGPLLFGLLLDAGFNFSKIAFISLIVYSLATFNSLRILKEK